MIALAFYFVGYLTLASSAGPVPATLTHGPYRSEAECAAERLRALPKLQAMNARVGECEAR